MPFACKVHLLFDRSGECGGDLEDWTACGRSCMPGELLWTDDLADVTCRLCRATHEFAEKRAEYN